MSGLMVLCLIKLMIPSLVSFASKVVASDTYQSLNADQILIEWGPKTRILQLLAKLEATKHKKVT